MSAELKGRQVGGWKVGRPAGLNDGVRNYKFGEPIPNMEKNPNFAALRNLGWIIPNVPETHELPIGEATVNADASEESRTEAQAGLPAAERRKILNRKRRRRTKRQRRASVAKPLPPDQAA